MAETAHCYEVRGLSWATVLRVVAEQAEAIRPLVLAGLRIELRRTTADLIVPSPFVGVHRDDPAMKAALEDLQGALNRAGVRFDPINDTASKLNLDSYDSPIAVLARLAAAGSKDKSDREAAVPLDDDFFALVSADDESQVATAVGVATWRAPAVRLSASSGRGLAAVLRFADIATTRAAAESFAQSQSAGVFRLVDVYSSGDIRLALARPGSARDASVVPSRQSLADFAAAVRAFPVSAADGVTTFAVVPDATTTEVWQFALPVRLAASPAFDEAVSNTELRIFLPDDEAHLRLEEAWRRLPKAGHQLELVSVSAASLDTPTRLIEQIRTLERKLALAMALRAPQFRLLRFTSRQTEAMVDALRRMPPEIIARGAIRYGFHATRNSPSGVHYLGWLDSEATPESHFGEHFWRAQTEDQPMRYWVDPAWARFYVDQAGRVKSRIMVPEGYRLSPTLHAFDQDDMDAVLRNRLAEGHEVPDQPIYLVSPSKVAGFTHSIEILDFAALKPLKTQVGWISNVLQVLPELHLAEFVEQAADLSVRRQILDNLSNGLKATRDGLLQAEAELEAMLNGRLGNYLTMLSREVDALADHMLRLGRLVEELTGESEQAERFVTAVANGTAGYSERIARLATDSSSLAAERKSLADGLVRTVAATDAFVETTGARLEVAADRLERLRELAAELRDE